MPDTSTAQSAARVDLRALARVRRRLESADAAPWLHSEAARRMADRLSLILRRPKQVLDWSHPAGEPDMALRSACPDASLRVVTAAGQMDRLEPPARPWWARWRPGGASVPRIGELDLTPGQVDLVWSCMQLHFQPDPREAFKAWRRALAVDGFVMFTTLGPGTLAPLRRAYTEAGWGEPFAAFTDMHDLGDMMVEAGLADPVMDQDVLYLTYPSAHAALAELRSLGSNFSPNRFAGLRTPRWRDKLLAVLEKLAGADGRVCLPFELVHGHAFRAPDRGPAVAPDTRIELQDMKLMLRKRTSG